MHQVNVYEAKTQLSRLLEEAVAGEDVVIARAGRPVVRLVPVAPPPARRPGRGAWRGRLRMAEDFDVTPAEVVAAFESGGFPDDGPDHHGPDDHGPDDEAS